MKKIVITIAAVACLGLSGRVQADSIFGEFQRLPDEIERGFSVGADFGMLVLTGQSAINTSAKNPGFQMTFTTGYDLTEYLSLEGVYTLAINEANPLDPVLTGGVNTFIFDGVVKGQLPWGRLRPFVEVGAGLFYSRPAFVVGKKSALDIPISGGVEYYTYLRHYSLFVKATYHYVKLPIDAFTVAGGLKFTF